MLWEITINVTPLSDSSSCDARMGGFRPNGLRGATYTHPTSTHQKTLLTPVNLSLLHFTQDIPVPMNTFCAKTLKLTIMWCHMVTIALKGLWWDEEHPVFA